MANNPPCKNCSDRHYRCHSECERYITYSEEKKAEREERIKANETKRGFYEHSLRLKHRLKHDKNKSIILKSTKK